MEACRMEKGDAMRLKDIMSKKVLTIKLDDSISAAAARMKESNVGCLLVVGSGLQGIITDRDLAVRCIAEEHDTCDCQVSGHMSNPVITGTSDMDVLDAARLMTQKQIKRLPVMDGQNLVGLVSLSDIALALDRPMHDVLIGMGAARRAVA